MPRSARIKGPECTYHIIARGNNKQNIFIDNDDKTRFLNTIKKFKIKYNFILYTYVLMDNHIHIIMNSNGEDISKIMQSINISYTYYFNRKYNRTGHLFQDRFKSIIIDDESYLINLSKYIHNNPKRAGMAARAYEYPWSSCGLYTSDTEDMFDIVNVQFILNILSNDVKKSKSIYLDYIDESETEYREIDKLKEPNKSPINKRVNSIRLSVPLILNAVAHFYKLPIDDILLKNNRKHSFIRHECFYIVRLKSGESIRNIGRMFGEVCESAVSYGINRTIDRMMVDKGLQNRISGILSLIA